MDDFEMDDLAEFEDALSEEGKLDLDEFQDYWKGPKFVSDERAQEIEEIATVDGSVADALLAARQYVSKVVREAPYTVVKSAKDFNDEMKQLLGDALEDDQDYL